MSHISDLILWQNLYRWTPGSSKLSSIPINNLYIIYIVNKKFNHLSYKTAPSCYISTLQWNIYRPLDLQKSFLGLRIVLRIASAIWKINQYVLLSFEGFCLSNTLKCINSHYYFFHVVHGFQNFFCHLNVFHLKYLWDFKINILIFKYHICMFTVLVT